MQVFKFGYLWKVKDNDNAAALAIIASCGQRLISQKKMPGIYIENKIFEKIIHAESPLIAGEYENCRFLYCDFSNGDFSAYKFIECEFEACNLSLLKLDNTAFREVRFKQCKMLGLHFDTCNKFGLLFRFEACLLDNSIFYNTKIKGTVFKKCQLREADFGDCDLTAAVFAECDLDRAIFDHSILEKADFRTAYNFSIDPEINRIKKAKFASSGLAGLLGKYDLDVE
jgi:uncharacterized protein YjbI with pentapeptide repeats